MCSADRTREAPASLVSPAITLREFVYKHDMDENGLIYFLGTNFGQQAWDNPMTLGEQHRFLAVITVPS